MLDLVFFDFTVCNGMNADRLLAPLARAIWLGTLCGEVPRLFTVVTDISPIGLRDGGPRGRRGTNRCERSFRRRPLVLLWPSGVPSWKGRGPSAWTAHPRGPSQNIPIRASKGMTCPDLGEIGFGRGRGFSQVVFPAPLLLVQTFRFAGIYRFGAFGVATLATDVRVWEGFIESGDAVPVAVVKTNCALDYDSPLGFAVILSSRWG